MATQFIDKKSVTTDVLDRSNAAGIGVVSGKMYVHDGNAPKALVAEPSGSADYGTVTQATNRSTGVTLNKRAGAITTNNTSLAAAAEATFTVTNDKVAVGDVIVISTRSGQTAGTSIATVTAVAAGSFDITLTNLHASTADTGAMIINFVVLKATA